MIAVHSGRFARAMQLAYELHADDMRKGDNRPAIGHLFAVTGIVIEYGGSEDEAIAALLHDAIEDAGGKQTEMRIRDEFGAAVSDIVRGCSDTDQTPKPPWEPRKRAYLDHLPSASASVRFVSCADKLANVRDLIEGVRRRGDAFWRSFGAPKERQLWLYDAYADAFGREPSPAMAEELRIQVDRLRELADGARDARA